MLENCLNLGACYWKDQNQCELYDKFKFPLQSIQTMQIFNETVIIFFFLAQGKTAYYFSNIIPQKKGVIFPKPLKKFSLRHALNIKILGLKIYILAR